MLTWKQDNGKYFCYIDGVIIAPQWVQDDNGKWYYLDKDGSICTGWFQTNVNDNHWFYAYKEQTEKDGDTHYVGEMATGWIEDNNGWYYLYTKPTTSYNIDYPTGAMAVDWIKLGEKNKWYYLLKDKTEYNGSTHSRGEAACNTTLVLNGDSYTFDSNGVMQVTEVTGENLVSDNLVSYTSGWESFYQNAYEDPYYPGDERYWTIGFGTCKCANSSAFPDGLDSTCTEEQALVWLKQELNKCAATIKAALGDSYNTMSQCAFDCLVDIAYNAGTGALIGGNTWNAIISGDEEAISSRLMSWNKANGITSPGLTKRCISRVNMCLDGVYDSTH